MSTTTHLSPETAPLDPEALHRLLPATAEELQTGGRTDGSLVAGVESDEPNFDDIVHGLDPQYDERVAAAKQVEVVPLRDRMRQRLGRFATGAVTWVRGRRTGQSAEAGPAFDLSVFDTQDDASVIEEAPETVPMPVVAEAPSAGVAEARDDVLPENLAVTPVQADPESSALVPTRSTRFLGRHAIGAEVPEEELPPGPDHERHQATMEMARKLDKDIVAGTEHAKRVIEEQYIPGLEAVVRQIDTAVEASGIKPSSADAWYVGPASSDEEYAQTLAGARARMADEPRRRDIHDRALAMSRIIPPAEDAASRVHAVTNLGRGTGGVVDVFAVPESARDTQVTQEQAHAAMARKVSMVHDLESPSGRHAAQG